MEELLFVGGIIALRAVLTILIHWEIKNEEMQNQKEGDPRVQPPT